MSDTNTHNTAAGMDRAENAPAYLPAMKPVLLQIWNEQRSSVFAMSAAYLERDLRFHSLITKDSANRAFLQLTQLKHSILRLLPAQTEGSITPGAPPETLAEIMESDLAKLRQDFARTFPL